jgi:malic enzyme
LLNNYFKKNKLNKNYLKYSICSNGDCGLGIGDWGLGIGPNPQSPIPNPHPQI